jgi:propanol-preferring alcohol dehydrogenase
MMRPAAMTAMTFAGAGRPLRARRVAAPRPAPHEVLLRVRACGVCRTDLHLIDGELPRPKAAVIPGHEIVGEVVARGARARRWRVGQRVGVPWLARACGRCAVCGAGREILCERAVFTG